MDTDTDPELRLMQELQGAIESFGPKTAYSVMEAVHRVITATHGVPREAVDRAMAWIEARTEERLKAEMDRRGRENKAAAAAPPDDEADVPAEPGTDEPGTELPTTLGLGEEAPIAAAPEDAVVG